MWFCRLCCFLHELYASFNPITGSREQEKYPGARMNLQDVLERNDYEDGLCLQSFTFHFTWPETHPHNRLSYRGSVPKLCLHCTVITDFFHFFTFPPLLSCHSPTPTPTPACQVGFFKATAGSVPCSECPANSRTSLEASNVCECRSGFYRASADANDTACTGEEPSLQRLLSTFTPSTLTAISYSLYVYMCVVNVYSTYLMLISETLQAEMTI